MHRFGLIGCGEFGSRRAEAIARSQTAELVAVYDSDPKAARRCAEMLKCEPVQSLDEILTNRRIQSVVIAVPNKFHAPFTINVLQAGKNVLCEKPMATSYEEALKIAREVRRTKLAYKVGANMRFFPNVRMAVQLLESGEIGDLLFVRGWIGVSRESHKSRWFSEKEQSGGGTLMDNGFHLLDVYMMFLKVVSECVCLTGNRAIGAGVEDNAMALLKSPDGQMASLQSSWTDWYGYSYIELYGQHGLVTIDCRNRGNTVGVVRKDGQRETYDYSSLPPSSLELEIRDFVDKVESNRELTPSARQSLAVMKLIGALYESSRLGKRIEVECRY